VLGTPRQGPADANEFDLVKLAKLWEGGEGQDASDSTDWPIDTKLRFVDESGQARSIATLLKDVFGLNQAVRPVSGTIQVIADGPEWREFQRETTGRW
jgi:hypothetical protein